MMPTAPDTPARPATPAPQRLGCPDTEPPSARPPTRRLRTLGRSLLRGLADAAALTGLTPIPISAEAAHHLATWVRPDPGGQGRTGELPRSPAKAADSSAHGARRQLRSRLRPENP